MAIIKAFEDQFGGKNERAYFKVAQTNIDWVEKKAHLVFGIYKDKEAREAGKQPLSSVELLIPTEISVGTPERPIKKELKFDTFFGREAEGKNAAEQAYKTLKEVPSFEESEDA